MYSVLHTHTHTCTQAYTHERTRARFSHTCGRAQAQARMHTHRHARTHAHARTPAYYFPPLHTEHMSLLLKLRTELRFKRMAYCILEHRFKRVKYYVFIYLRPQFETKGEISILKSLENMYDTVSEYLLSYLPQVFGHFISLPQVFGHLDPSVSNFNFKLAAR